MLRCHGLSLHSLVVLGRPLLLSLPFSLLPSPALQVYVNLGDNSDLDSQGFAPFGLISAADMVVFEKIYAGAYLRGGLSRLEWCKYSVPPTSTL